MVIVWYRCRKCRASLFSDGHLLSERTLTSTKSDDIENVNTVGNSSDVLLEKGKRVKD